MQILGLTPDLLNPNLGGGGGGGPEVPGQAPGVSDAHLLGEPQTNVLKMMFLCTWILTLPLGNDKL